MTYRRAIGLLHEKKKNREINRAAIETYKTCHYT